MKFFIIFGIFTVFTIETVKGNFEILKDLSDFHEIFNEALNCNGCTFHQKELTGAFNCNTSYTCENGVTSCETIVSKSKAFQFNTT